METLLPDCKYHLACDGVWVHRYTHPHAKNEKGENLCLSYVRSSNGSI
jgi:hypothetical protein